jgi:hypothetical protein
MLLFYLLAGNISLPVLYANQIDGKVALITATAYVEFLNRIAGPDTTGLYDQRCYNEMMSVDPIQGFVIRSGEVGNYHYEVIPGREYFPATYISITAGTEYCNWSFNGYPNLQEFYLAPLEGYYQQMDPNYNMKLPDTLKGILNQRVQLQGYYTLVSLPSRVNNLHFWEQVDIWSATSYSYLQVIHRWLAPGEMTIV